ncbi:class I SAM-dependent methyltransferase [Nonomuraea mesophila]|uniref:Class I SAM-dependent methyltransferase n=1 Tax=Nonomuraea mesophila TaxID=2530382 RepID=A0A4R5FUZ7_9ACTN|nr:class I SAM-dependent methyltransferase [Nonomuraea mesophila]TDE58134.1 class I SAM-dependent methyltransferase [Nonomuraea mesophila]
MEDPTSTTTASYDHIAPDYAARTEHPDDALQTFRQRFADAVPAGSTVADLGCGPGRDAAWLRERGLRVVGVDRSAAMTRLAATRGVPAVLGDLRRPPLTPGSLTGLWSVAALLHVPAADTEATLHAWRTALRPGGVLGLSTSAGDTEGWEELPRVAGRHRWFAHRDPGTLLRLLGAEGFDTVEHGLHRAERTWLSVLAIRREV